MVTDGLVDVIGFDVVVIAFDVVVIGFDVVVFEDVEDFVVELVGALVVVDVIGDEVVVEGGVVDGLTVVDVVVDGEVVVEVLVVGDDVVVYGIVVDAVDGFEVVDGEVVVEVVGEIRTFIQVCFFCITRCCPTTLYLLRSVMFSSALSKIIKMQPSVPN